MLLIIESGSPAARTAMTGLEDGLCQKGIWISGICARIDLLSVSWETPTTCHSMGAAGIRSFSADSRSQTRARRGSAPFRNLRTNSWLTIATLRLEGQSCSVKARPFIMRTPKVLKNSGETAPKPTLGHFEGSPSRADSPATTKGVMRGGKRGVPVCTEAEDTPARDCIPVSICL